MDRINELSSASVPSWLLPPRKEKEANKSGLKTIAEARPKSNGKLLRTSLTSTKTLLATSIGKYTAKTG
ncbi:hypothetical protein [Streptococcus suis]|uniref:hypothetical protein n=1 Tax=Streptococcus suis TaxID=1307 RepID=UPI003BA1A2E9